MRWIWIDRFTEFVSGSHAQAVKNVSLAEDFLEDHLPGHPLMPPSLMIEGMAQTAGILVGQAGDFKDNVILAKIRNAEFTRYAAPGDQIRYRANIESIDERAAATTGEVFINDEPAGKVNLMFSNVNHSQSAAGLPDHNFVFTEQFMQLFDAIRAQPAAE